jgi:hypothetical protein
VFCLLSGHDLGLDVNEAEMLMLAVARGELDMSQITVEIDKHLR